MKWLRSLFFKAASRFMTFSTKWSRYAFSIIGIEKLINEGYKKNAAVSACSTTLQLTFPEPPLLVGYEEEGHFIPDYKHPINNLLKKPNFDMGMAEFMQFVITYAPIGGNAYIWKQRSISGKILRLWIFSDLEITPIRGLDTSEGLVAYYELDPGDGQKVIIPKKDMIQWKWMIDPQNPHKGIGAIELSAREVDRDNEATSYIFALLKNNAVPPVVVTMEEGDDMTQEEADALSLKWRQKHSHGEPAFISHGMTVEQLGYDLNKLAAETLADLPETRIAANFKVPPSVAGLNVGIKRSDYGDTAARKAFTEQTLMALWRSFASEMYSGLKDDFNLPDNYTMQFDVSNVGALQELKKDQRAGVNELWKSGLFTRAEAKRQLGIKPLPGDDVYYVSLATEFVPAEVGVVVRSDEKTVGNKQLAVGGGERTESREQKVEGSKGSAVAQVLLRIRAGVAKQMQAAVAVYFSQLAERVVERVVGSKQLAVGSNQKADLPNARDLIDGDDRKKLETLIKRFYVEVIELSWNTWNVALGIEKAFDLDDSAVVQALKLAGKHIKDINDELLQNLRDALQYGAEQGWGIDQIVRGDENQPGLRDLLTDSDYARTVARAELGDAQNVATFERYRDAGVEKVEILDGGAADSAPACDLANGQIWTLRLFNAYRLQHPNCSRAAAPYFGDEEAVDSWAYEFGERG